MSAANKPVLRCCVCGTLVPYMHHDELIQKGLCTVKGDGSRVIHCNAGRHTPEQIIAALNGVPRFVRASEYGKSIASTIRKPDDCF